MALIKSISGFRGTIGNNPGDNLTPKDLVELSYGYAHWLKKQSGVKKPTVVLGRDGRVSGDML
ncbi:MAG: phosphoglucosamine mutase, partial [Luteibaculum sp.]